MKKRNKESDKKTSFAFVLFRNLVVAIVVIGGIFFAWQTIIAKVKNSELFRIRSIVVSDPSMQFIKTSRLINLKGHNIFAVHLDSLSRQLQMQYPEIAEIKLLKRFPDQIVVATKKRFPFAQTKIKNKDVTLDAQGIILSSAVNPEALPVISGIFAQKSEIIPGTQLKSDEARIALEVLRTFRMNKYLSVYKILRIDVTNLSQIEFYLTDSLKVITDQLNISERIQLLSLILSQAKLKLEDVSYIDIRFKEPIIRFKEPIKPNPVHQND